MPHKRNPILSENLTGLARYIRSATIPTMENIALWHERDISHSSVERILAPDINIAMDFALNRLSNIIENLIVYPENMEKNLNSLGGLHKSQDILKALIKKGLSRQEAYLNVQSLCTKAWNTKEKFIELLLKDNKINEFLSEKEIKKLLTNDDIKDSIDWIYKNKFKI